MRISDWSSDVCSSDLAGIEGAWRFVQRVWRLVDGTAPADGGDADLDRKLHKTIAGVGEDVDALQFNKAVAKLYELVNAVEKAKPSASRNTAVDTIRSEGHTSELQSLMRLSYAVFCLKKKNYI